MDHPGPIDRIVLDQQTSHRSEIIALGQPYTDIDVIHVEGRWRRAARQIHLHGRLAGLIYTAGFSGFMQVQFRSIDNGLITALVERWRPETHSFHFPVGEATVTLQDVEVLYGLRIDGDPVTGRRAPVDITWAVWCERYLGFTPEPAHFDGQSLRVTSLTQCIRARAPHMTEDDDDLVVAQDARVLCACMIVSLFIDTGGVHVKLMYLLLLEDLHHSGTLSWGSATLATLYRNLCSASHKARGKIAGPVGLLQMWAWERLNSVRPERVRQRTVGPILFGPHSQRWTEWTISQVHDTAPAHVSADFRDIFDRMGIDEVNSNFFSQFNLNSYFLNIVNSLVYCLGQIIWEPYIYVLDTDHLPAYCLRSRDIWRARVRLVCFGYVEWHLPDRVLRQFGMSQPIPESCDTGLSYHRWDERRRGEFRDLYPDEFGDWDRRNTFVVPTPVEHHPIDRYMRWYRQITRRVVGVRRRQRAEGYPPAAPDRESMV